MAQIPDDVRQNIADAADGYINAYIAKQNDVTSKETLYEDAVIQYDTSFQGRNVPISEIETSQDNARNLYSNIVSTAEAYDAQMASFAPTIVAFLSAFQQTGIDFPELGKRLTVSGGNVVVSNI